MNMRALLLSVLAVLLSSLTSDAGLNGPAAYIPAAWYNDGQLRNPYSGRPIITEQQAARNDQMMRLQERQYTAKSDEQAASIFRQMQTLSQQPSPSVVPPRPLLSVGNGAYVGPMQNFPALSMSQQFEPRQKMPVPGIPNGPGVMHEATYMSHGAQKQLQLLAAANDNAHREMTGQSASKMGRQAAPKQARSTRQKPNGQSQGRTLSRAQMMAIHAKD